MCDVKGSILNKQIPTTNENEYINEIKPESNEHLNQLSKNVNLDNLITVCHEDYRYYS
jgi:hypothetical protein